MSHLPRACPPCPKHLDSRARSLWRLLCRDLAAAGAITTADRLTLALLCQAWSQLLRAEEKIARFDVVILSRTSAAPRISPYVIVAQQTARMVRSLIADLGLSRAARK